MPYLNGTKALRNWSQSSQTSEAVSRQWDANMYRSHERSTKVDEQLIRCTGWQGKHRGTTSTGTLSLMWVMPAAGLRPVVRTRKRHDICSGVCWRTNLHLADTSLDWLHLQRVGLTNQLPRLCLAIHSPSDPPSHLWTCLATSCQMVVEFVAGFTLAKPRCTCFAWMSKGFGVMLDLKKAIEQ